MIPLLVAVGVAGVIGVTTKVLSNEAKALPDKIVKEYIKECRTKPIKKGELPPFLQKKLELAEQNNYKNNK